MIFVKQNMISRGSNFYLLQKEAGCRYTFLYDLSILIISQVFLKLRNWDFYRLKVGSLFSCEHSCHQCLVFKKIQRFSCRLRVMLERNTNYTRTTILKSGQGNPYDGAGPAYQQYQIMMMPNLASCWVSMDPRHAQTERACLLASNLSPSPNLLCTFH